MSVTRLLATAVKEEAKLRWLLVLDVWETGQSVQMLNEEKKDSNA